MAPSAVIDVQLSCATRLFKTHQPFSSEAVCASKTVNFTIRASTLIDNYAPSMPVALLNRGASSWRWKYQGNSVNIQFEKFGKEGNNGPCINILMVPTISDVSTVEELRVVAEETVRKNGGIDLSATIVDWPGLGYSDWPTRLQRQRHGEISGGFYKFP